MINSGEGIAPSVSRESLGDSVGGLEDQAPETDSNQVDIVDPETEIKELLAAQDNRLGQVYRLSVQQGLPAKEVANALHVETSGFVSNNLSTIRTITGEREPSSPSLAKQARSSISSFIKANQGNISKEALELLKSRRDRLSSFISKEEKEDVVEPEFAETTDNDLKNLAGVPGIYAFSYGWYLENPEHRDFGADATLFKVGLAHDLEKRMKQHIHSARTVIPEPVVLVRAYRAEESHLDQVEKSFHRLLKSAGHANRRTKKIGRKNETGTEWFLTNSDFLDAIADTLGLSTVWTGDSEFADVTYNQ